MTCPRDGVIWTVLYRSSINSAYLIVNSKVGMKDHHRIWTAHHHHILKIEKFEKIWTLKKTQKYFRYANKDQISLVATQSSAPLANGSLLKDAEYGALVQRVQMLEFNSRRQNRKQSNWSKTKAVQCSHCVFLNKQLDANLPTNHPTGSCNKKFSSP